MPPSVQEFAHLTHENTVTCEQIVQALDSIGKSFSLEDYTLNPNGDKNWI